MRYAEYLRPSRIPMRLPVAARERGLVLYLPMVSPHGNILQDFSGYGNHGTIYGATWTQGKFGKALSFDGVDDYVDCGNDESLEYFDEITVTAWAELNVIDPDSWDRIVDSKRWGIQDSFLLFRNKNDNLWRWGIYDTKFKEIASKDTIETGVWYFLAGTFKDGTSKFYVNGVLQGERNDITSARLQTQGIRVGHFNSANCPNGTIDEVRIYNRALSEEEIRRHFLGLQYLVRG